MVSAECDGLPIVVQGLTAELLLSESSAVATLITKDCTAKVGEYPVRVRGPEIELFPAAARTVVCEPKACAIQYSGIIQGISREVIHRCPEGFPLSTTPRGTIPQNDLLVTDASFGPTCTNRYLRVQ
jgi:hypothetical protein